MTDVLEQVNDLKRKLSEHEAARAKAEATKALAEDRLREAALALRDEFGVKTVGEAREMLASLEKTLEADVAALTDLLKEA